MTDIIKLLENQGVLPLFFNQDEKASIDIMEALYKAGIKALEYTNRGQAALDNFKSMVEIRNNKFPDVKLGIGTIKNLKQAKEFIVLGADFIISPGIVDEVMDYCRAKNILYIPGCMTPTEIIRAENGGIKVIKLFPGDILKLSFLKAVKPVFPDLYFMPTGGVETSYDNMKSWFDAGVFAVGMGSKLISKQLMEERDYKSIALNTEEVLAIIKEIRNNN